MGGEQNRGKVIARKDEKGYKREQLSISYA
jgi:hypothetical protein